MTVCIFFIDESIVVFKIFILGVIWRIDIDHVNLALMRKIQN